LQLPSSWSFRGGLFKAHFREPPRKAVTTPHPENPLTTNCRIYQAIRGARTSRKKDVSMGFALHKGQVYSPHKKKSEFRVKLHPKNLKRAKDEQRIGPSPQVSRPSALSHCPNLLGLGQWDTSVGFCSGRLGLLLQTPGLAPGNMGSLFDLAYRTALGTEPADQLHLRIFRSVGIP